MFAAEEMRLCVRRFDANGKPMTMTMTKAEGTAIPVYTKHFHPHEFRHTAASLAIAAGADVKVVQQMLGHKSATMTLDLYGHLFADRLDHRRRARRGPECGHGISRPVGHPMSWPAQSKHRCGPRCIPPQVALAKG